MVVPDDKEKDDTDIVRSDCKEDDQIAVAREDIDDGDEEEDDQH